MDGRRAQVGTSLRRLPLVAAIASLIPSLLLSTPAATEAGDGCRFKLGFETLHDLIPDVVGDCLDDEGHNPANGDGLQHTTAWHGSGGLLVWRKADNWTAFTDGATTWINGPFGLASRPNAGPLFPWEAAAPPPPRRLHRRQRRLRHGSATLCSDTTAQGVGLSRPGAN